MFPGPQQQHLVRSCGLRHASDSAFFPCARTRTLQLTSIRLLEDFSTLGELLRVFRDAIEGHKHLYTNGLLHCDIRPENIIIYEREPASDVTDAGGYLVDSDHVKIGRLSDPAVEVPTAERRAYVMTLPDEDWQVGPIVRGIEDTLEELKEPKISDLLNGAKLDIQKDAFLWAHSIHYDPGFATSYLMHAIVHSLRFGNLRGNGICSLANLHWNQITKHYDFAIELSDDCEQDSRTPNRTGTLRFSSYEMLSGESYFLGDNSKHDAIHDIESFFWVLIHLCMTREGPGGVRRRKELDCQNPAFSQQLYLLVRDAFDYDLRCQFEFRKRRFFRSVDHFKNEVIANFHPYFEGLKGLVLEWYSLLRLAYKFNGYEYHAIHDGVLRIFDNALVSRLT